MALFFGSKAVHHFMSSDSAISIFVFWTICHAVARSLMDLGHLVQVELWRSELPKSIDPSVMILSTTFLREVWS